MNKVERELKRMEMLETMALDIKEIKEHLGVGEESKEAKKVIKTKGKGVKKD